MTMKHDVGMGGVISICINTPKIKNMTGVRSVLFFGAGNRLRLAGNPFLRKIFPRFARCKIFRKKARA